MRWRVGKEVESGKGQFACGARGCDTAQGLRSWEMNFAYKERQEHKNALVKLRECFLLVVWKGKLRECFVVNGLEWKTSSVLRS